MKNDDFVGVRVPKHLRSAIERERQRASKVAGVEVKTSAVIRAALEEKFSTKRARKARAA